MSPAHETDLTTWSARIRRVSWGAILAGFICALSLQLLMGLLGLAFGFWSIDPMSETYPLSGLGTSAFVWWTVTGIIALFIGGCIAGRMSGYHDRIDGLLQGVTVWGLLSLVTFYLAGTTMGMVVNATAAVVSGGVQVAGQGLQAAGAGIANVAQATSGAVQEAAAGDGTAGGEGHVSMRPPHINFDTMAQELNAILNDTGKEELSPENLQQAAEKLRSEARSAAKTMLQRPDRAQQEVDRVLDVFYAELGEVRSAVDRQAVVNVLTANTDVSEQEAQRIVDRWQDQYEEASQQVASARNELQSDIAATRDAVTTELQQAKTSVLKATEETLDYIAYAALWSFASLLCGLVAAAGGGYFGPQILPPQA